MRPVFRSAAFFRLLSVRTAAEESKEMPLTGSITSGDLTAQQGILVTIEDTIFGSTGNFTGGHIGGNAIVTLTAQNITTPSTNSGTPGNGYLWLLKPPFIQMPAALSEAMPSLDVSASQNISAPGSVLFWVANGNYLDLGGGTIGGNAEVNVSAANISTGDFFDQILNYGGASIGGHAAINITADTLSVGGNLDSRIDNSEWHDRRERCHQHERLRQRYCHQ